MADGHRYRILTGADELISIRAEWDRLWADTGAEYVLSFSSMALSWNTIHRPQGAALRCAVVCHRGRLLGVLPMILHRHKFWRTATTCGPRAAESCDMLLEKRADSHAIACELWRKFLLLARPDYVNVEFVRRGSYLETAIQSIPSIRMLETWDENIPYADLKMEKDWQSYERSLSKSYQADCARTSRRLHERGKVTFVVVRGTPTPLIDWLFLHKQRWSERTNKRGEWVFSEYYREFMNTLFYSDPRCLVFALTLDDVPIAVKLMTINANSASLIIITYDEKYKHFSPGKILDERMMKYVFENYRSGEGRHLDISFGPGMEKFKLHWSRGQVYPTTSYRMVTSRWGSARTRVKEAIAGLRKRML